LRQLLSDLVIAWRNLTRNRQRSVVSIMTVASGIVAFSLASGFIAWIFVDMRDSTVRSQLGHVQIVRPYYFDKGIADPYSFLLGDGREQFPKLAALEGVVSVTPRLAFSGLASLGDATVSFIGEGVSPSGEKPISARINIDVGKDLQSDNEAAVILGEGLAASLGATVGDRIVLLVTTDKGGAGAVEVEVAGVFNTTSKEFDDHALRLPIQRARTLMKVDGATAWVMLLDSHLLTQRVIEQLKSFLPGDGYQLVPWSDLADFYNKTVTLFKSQIQVVKVIIGLIIVLSISNTQTMSVLERTTEIGTMLALGQKRGIVMRLFILEGLLIGLLGGVIGISIGWLAAQGISAVGIPMPPAPGMAHGFTGAVILTSEIAVESVLLAVTTTLLASLLPAFRASRLNIVDALRYNQ
jgi:putative ABC transport system permease protein